MQPSAVAKIECGDRRVDVDDLAALAAALNVSPARLLVPDVGIDDDVHVVPGRAVPAWSAWQWATGQHSLAQESDDLRDQDVQIRELEFANERPAWLRASEAKPLAGAARHLNWTVTRALSYVARDEVSTTDQPAPLRGVSNWVAKVRQALAGVERELDEFEEAERDVER